MLTLYLQGHKIIKVVHVSLSVIAMSRGAAKSTVFLNLSQPIFNLPGHGDGALQVLVAGLWQGL